MNSRPLLFLGIFATLASSFWGFVLAPQLQLGRQEQVPNQATFGLYPHPRGGAAKQGADVYRSLGCVECHSQQVRGLGNDTVRGWGARKTVAQDYLGDYPVLLGAQRVGPDLANVGLRQTNAVNLLQHLFDPQSTVPGSTMPPYRFLFDKRELKSGQSASPDALVLGNGVIEAGYEVVPLPEASALVDYLLSLRADAPLYEAPLPKSSTNTTEAVSTNAAATSLLLTNASAASNATSAAPSTPPVK